MGRLRWAVDLQSRWLLVAVLVFLGAAAPVLADDAPGDSSPPTSPKGTMAPAAGGLPTGPNSKAVTEAYRLAKEEEEEREEELASPAAEKERKDSLRAYVDLSPAQAEALLVASFPEFLASLNSDPARSLSDSRLDRNLGEGNAVVTTDGKTQLMEGSFPVETRNDEGNLEKVDVTLEETAQGYEAENPLVEVAIADSVEEGIVVGGHGSVGNSPPITIVQVGAEGSVARPLGDKNVFYGEVEPDSDIDLFVAPTTYGVELANLLRTVDSPETLRFHVDLPAGAQLRAGRGGGAEILAADDELLYRVNRPISFDAQGTTVPTTLEIEGDNLVVRVPHREADVAYPILVDPELQMDWGHPGFPGIAPYGPWYPSESWANNGMYLGTSDGYWPGLSGLYFHAHNAGIAAGAWDQLTYYPPNEQSYIARAFIHIFHRGDSCSPLVQDPYDYTGMYVWNNGGTPVGPYWSGYRNNDAYKQGWANVNSWGNALVIGYGNASTKVNACWRRVRVGLITIWLEDWQYPYLDSVGATPTGWLKKDATPRSFSVSASDAGLGVRTVRMFGVGTPDWQWNKGWCAGTYGNPCGTSGSGQITFTTNGFPYEGRYNGEGKERKFAVQVEDPTKKTWKLERPIWLDGTAPSVKLSGQLATVTKQVGEAEKPQNEEGDHDDLSLPTYKLEITADDLADRSGVQEIKVFLDKDPSKEPGAVPTATKSAGNCPTAGCSQTLTMDYTLRLPGLDAGKHSLWIVAVDKVGNESDLSRNIEFEYFPATGMKDSYVLQHIRLPDGVDRSEEEPYRGPEIAVNVINGNLVYHERDLVVQTEEAGLELERLYNSQAPTEEDGQWGHGWTIAQTPELDAEEGPSPQKATMVQGGEITPGVDLPALSGEETFNPDLQATIEKRAGGGYEVTDEAEDDVAVFNDSGRIEEERLADVPDEAAPPPGPEELEEPTFADAYGTTGTAAGEFEEISDAVADAAGNLWVVDRGNDRVQKLGPRGAVLAQIGSSGTGNGQFDSPASIAIDAEGDLWILDSGNDRVQQFSPAGAFMSKFGVEGSGSGQLEAAEGIAVSPGGHVWVADTGNSRLQEFSQAGVPLQAVGTKTPGQGNLGEPTGVDVDSDGDVWVVDWKKNRIVIFDPEGEFVDQFGVAGTGAGEFDHPRSIAFDGDAEGWVSDEGNARVQHFDSDGEFVEAFGAPGNAVGRFSHPTGIAIDDHGNLWVGDTGGARVSPGKAATGPTPVAAYSFDEGEGDVLADSAGNHDGTIEGATWTEGKFGNALSFDGEGACVSVPSALDLQLGEALTAEAWVKPQGSGSSEPVLTKESETFFTYNFGLPPSAEWKSGAAISDDPGSYSYTAVQSAEQLAEDAWAHVAMTFDGETLRHYVDGELVDSEESPSPAESNEPLTFGCVHSLSEYFEGKIDEVRLYDVALSKAEIETDMETAIGPAPADLDPVAAYSFAEGEGETAYDEFGKNDGTLDGAQWSDEGKFGAALEFDGVDDLLTVPDADALDFTGAFTLEAWVQPAEANEWSAVFTKERGQSLSYQLHAEGWNEGPTAVIHDGSEIAGIDAENRLPPGEWSHLAVTSDGETLRLYVNGEVVESGPGGIAVPSGGDLQIGGNLVWGEEDAFKGLIDEVRLYDRTLSEAEIGEDMAAPVATDRLQKWQTSVYSEEAVEWPEPPSIDYDYEDEDLIAMDLEENENPETASIDVDLFGGLSKEASAGEEESVEYSYEAGMLTEADGLAGTSEYEYDGSERLERVELPNGTVATIEYDGTERVIAVTVDPAGEEGPQTTHFSYSTEPRRTAVWGGGEPEVTYDIGEDGSVLKWAWAESPPTIETISGSLWSKRNSTIPIENKVHTLFVTASSPHQIAKVQVVVNGRAVVEETTCEDPSEPPEHNCDQPPPLEWITHAAQHPPGRLNLEVVATDFLGRESSESFFVTVPQQPPEDPEAPPRPSFDQIKTFREEYGLDRERNYTQAEFNALILELLYEWESDYPAARAGVEGWGAPMRQPELSELEFREQYVEQAAELIPEWAEAHAPGTYGGYYVDHRAGGVIHVGFTEGQATAVAAIRQIPGLLAPESMIQGYPQSPTLSVAAISATEEAVADAVGANQSILDVVTRIDANEVGSRIQVGATDVGTVSAFIVGQFGAGAPIDVIHDNQSSEATFSRFPGYFGPVYAGQGLESNFVLPGTVTWRCTSGFGARTLSDDNRQGRSPYLYFVLTAGHCFPKGHHVQRPLSREIKDPEHQFPIGKVRRTKWLGPSGPGDDNWSVDAAAILLANPHNASKDMYVGNPKKLAAVRGAKPIRRGMNVCRSGINGGVACGPVVDSYWASYKGKVPPIEKRRLVPVFVVRMGSSAAIVEARCGRGRAAERQLPCNRLTAGLAAKNGILVPGAQSPK